MSLVTLQTTGATVQTEVAVAQSIYDALNPFAYTHPSLYRDEMTDDQTVHFDADLPTGETIKRVPKVDNLGIFFTRAARASSANAKASDKVNTKPKGPAPTWQWGMMALDLPFARGHPGAIPLSAPPVTPALSRVPTYVPTGLAGALESAQDDDDGPAPSAYPPVPVDAADWTRATSNHRLSGDSFHSWISASSGFSGSSGSSGKSWSSASFYIAADSPEDEVVFGKKQTKVKGWAAAFARARSDSPDATEVTLPQ